ncbi:LOW QUALITY PROTEIN: hypothetical protein V1478_004156 [Vespula squamosa]|uniref:Uncharacterized protein n=1 Tax=Vespula squamosa TaxID=30214 RepID=A0ABD2BNU6_VESSQ
MESNGSDGSDGGDRNREVRDGGDGDGGGLIPMEVKGEGRCSQTAIMGLDFDVDSQDTCHAKQENPLKICTRTYILSQENKEENEEEKEQDKEEIEVEEEEETSHTPNWLVNQYEKCTRRPGNYVSGCPFVRLQSFLERHAAANADDDTTRIQAKTGAS